MKTRIICLIVALFCAVGARSQSVELHVPIENSPFITLQYANGNERGSIFTFVDIPLANGLPYFEIAAEATMFNVKRTAFNFHAGYDKLLASNVNGALLLGVGISRPYFSVAVMWRKNESNTYQVTASWRTNPKHRVNFCGYIDIWDREFRTQPQLWVRLFHHSFYVGTEFDIGYSFRVKEFLFAPTIGVKYEF